MTEANIVRQDNILGRSKYWTTNCMHRNLVCGHRGYTERKRRLEQRNNDFFCMFAYVGKFALRFGYLGEDPIILFGACGGNLCFQCLQKKDRATDPQKCRIKREQRSKGAAGWGAESEETRKGQWARKKWTKNVEDVVSSKDSRSFLSGVRFWRWENRLHL